MTAPLGPVREKPLWYRKPDTSSGHGGWDYDDTYFVDSAGREYRCVDQVLMRAVARGLEL